MEAENTMFGYVGCAAPKIGRGVRITVLVLGVLFLLVLRPAAAQEAYFSNDSLNEPADSAVTGDLDQPESSLAGAPWLRKPTDSQNLFIRALAAVAERDLESALSMSLDAFTVAETETDRYLAARLAALVHAELRHFTRAQFWLRRAWPNAPDGEAARGIQEDFRFIRQSNPLTTSLQFGIAPSSNVNGGSASEILILPGLPFEFVLDGEARALSGVQVSGGVNVSYRLDANEHAATYFNGTIQGHTYFLSAEAREQAPDANGSDYADVSLTMAISHRWLPDGASGPWWASASFGQTWYDNSAYLNFFQASLAKTTRLDARTLVKLSAHWEWQHRLQDHEQFPGYGARIEFNGLTEAGNEWTGALSYRSSYTELPDVGYQSVGLSASYILAQTIMDLRLGIGADLELQDFAETRYAVDGRQDIRSAVRLTVGLPSVQILGFEPLITLETSQTQSNVDLFDKEDIRVNIGIRSSF